MAVEAIDAEATSGDTDNPRQPKSLALKREFVAWLLEPTNDREIKTLGEWAVAHNVHRATLWEWKNSPEIVEMLKRWREMYEPVWARAVATLGAIATDPDHPNVVQGIRTLAELMDKFPDKRVKVDHTISVTSLYGAAAAALEAGDNGADIIEGEISPA